MARVATSSAQAEDGAGLDTKGHWLSRREGKRGRRQTSTRGQKLQASPASHRPLGQGRQGHLLGPAIQVWAQNAGIRLGLAVHASQGTESQLFKSLSPGRVGLETQGPRLHPVDPCAPTPQLP